MKADKRRKKRRREEERDAIFGGSDSDDGGDYNPDAPEELAEQAEYIEAGIDADIEEAEYQEEPEYGSNANPLAGTGTLQHARCFIHHMSSVAKNSLLGQSMDLELYTSGMCCTE